MTRKNDLVPFFAFAFTLPLVNNIDVSQLPTLKVMSGGDSQRLLTHAL